MAVPPCCWCGHGTVLSPATWRRNAREMTIVHSGGMLLRRVLLRLPDRPGSLGRVTMLLGRLGIDIHQVRVLARDGVVATDEFVVALPGPVIQTCLVELLEEVDGVRVLGSWPVEEPDDGWWPSPAKEAGAASGAIGTQ
jgi:hypothetical protein